MGYASIQNGSAGTTDKTTETRTVRSFMFNNVRVRLKQTVETVVEEWHGLSQANAETLCVSSETSTLSGTTRQYLGSAEVTVYVVGDSSTMSVKFDEPDCWGVRVVARMFKRSPRLYDVVKTTQTLTVSAAPASSGSTNGGKVTLK